MNSWVWLRANIISNDHIPQLYSLSKVLLGNKILLDGLKSQKKDKVDHAEMIEIEKLALKKYSEAAKLGNKIAFSILGFYYENGLAGLKVNYYIAEKFYNESISQNTKTGLSLVRLSFLKNYGRPNIIINPMFSKKCKLQAKVLGSEIALAWLRNLAENGHIDALSMLASSYYNGLGVEKDQDRAFHYAKIAAENGNSSAQNLIGMIYFEGTATISSNKDLALFWYQRAAASNEAAALYNIAMLYENGTAVTQNYNEAFKYYHKSAELGSVSGTNIIGFFYEHGIGTEASKMYAFSNYYKAALQGSPFGQYNVGRCFLHGIGVEEDIKRAVKWLESSGKQGHGNAYLTLAVLYDFGISVNKNKKLAKKWYHKAYRNNISSLSKKLIPEIALDVLKVTRSLLIPKNKNSSSAKSSNSLSSKIPSSSLNDITCYNSVEDLTTLNQSLQTLDMDYVTSSLEIQTNSLRNLQLKFPSTISHSNSSTNVATFTRSDSVKTLVELANELTTTTTQTTTPCTTTTTTSEEKKNYSNTKTSSFFINSPHDHSNKSHEKSMVSVLPNEILYQIIDVFNVDKILSVKTMSNIVHYISERPIKNNTKLDFFKYIGIDEFTLNDNESNTPEERINHLFEQLR